MYRRANSRTSWSRVSARLPISYLAQFHISYSFYRAASHQEYVYIIHTTHACDGLSPFCLGACQKMKINPKITLIIVGKRHHIRYVRVSRFEVCCCLASSVHSMFPQNPRDGDRSGNCQAGTTIDEGLGHPTEFDYYQLTHGGLLGTSRPAHYSVRFFVYLRLIRLTHLWHRSSMMYVYLSNIILPVICC